MYWPPESGNMEPNSANAKQAHNEIKAPSTHTDRNRTGCGSGPEISFAVRKMEDPMIPLTSRRTESSSPSPRTRVGFSSDDFSAGLVISAGKTVEGSIIRFRVRPAIPEECRTCGKSPRSSHRTSEDL